MDNLVYLQSIGVTDKETQQRCLDAMEKYQDNKWWEPDVDPRKYAYYQLQEPLFLSGDGGVHFGESLMLLLGRPVHRFELATNEVAIRQEAERAWTYQVGCISEQEREERAIDGLRSIAKHVPVILMNADTGNIVGILDESERDV